MMDKTKEAVDKIEVESIGVTEGNEHKTEKVADKEQPILDHNGSKSDGEQPNDDEVVVSIGEVATHHEEESRAPEWVRDLRKQNREKSLKIRELEAKLQAVTQTENKPVVLGAKPKLEDYDWDSDKFETAMADWHERKHAVDKETEKARQAEQAQRDAWQARLESYGKARAELKVNDFEDAESAAQELLDVTQQGIVVHGADNPALVIYALGKNPKKAKEIASIKDPVKFAFAVAKLEKELKVTSRNRNTAPPPESTISGTARVSGAVDSQLDALRAQAAKTGDYSKVFAYKAQLKQKK